MGNKYYAQRDGFIAGRHYSAGDPVEIMDSAAKYLAPPYGSDLGAKPPVSNAGKGAVKKPAETRIEAGDTSGA